MPPRPRAAAREKGPEESARQQARNINTHVVNAENVVVSAESVVVSAESVVVSTENAENAENGARALALRGFVPRFRSLK